MALDANGNLLATSTGALSRLDLVTSNWEVLVSGGELSQPEGLVVSGESVFMADSGASAVLRYQPGLGVSVVSSGGMLGAPTSLVQLLDGDFVVADIGGLVRIDATTGAQRLFAPTPAVTDLLVDSLGMVYAIRRTESCPFGAVERMAPDGPSIQPGVVLCADGKLFGTLHAMARDPSNSDMIMLGMRVNPGIESFGNQEPPSAQRAVFSLNPTTGTTKVLSIDSVYRGGFAFDSRGRLYGAGQAGVYEINPRNGLVTPIASHGFLGYSIDLVVSADDTELFVLDYVGVIRVNPLTTAQHMVTSGGMLSGQAHRLRWGSSGNLLVGETDSVVSIDTTTGAQTVAVPAYLGDFADAGGGRYYGLNVNGDRKLARFDAGVRTNIGTFTFDLPTCESLQLNADGTLWVGDAGHLFRIDPDTATITDTIDVDCGGPHMEFAVIADPVCGNGFVEGAEQCDGGACCTETCDFVTSDTECRPVAGACDVAEVCTGTRGACPADLHIPGCTTSTTTTTTTTTLPCDNARCVLDGSVRTGPCADETVSPAIQKNLTTAANLIDRATSKSPRKAGRLLHRAARLLTKAGRGATKDSTRKRPTLSVECAASVRTAADDVRQSLRL